MLEVAETVVRRLGSLKELIMRQGYPFFLAVVLLITCQRTSRAQVDQNFINNEKIRLGLSAKEIHAGMTSEKMLDRSLPATKRQIGRFTEYDFTIMEGYWGIAIIAKDGRLMRAFEWSCTSYITYFDEMTREDEKQWKSLRARYENLPPERLLGRWGWESTRLRLLEPASR